MLGDYFYNGKILIKSHYQQLPSLITTVREGGALLLEPFSHRRTVSRNAGTREGEAEHTACEMTALKP